VQEKVSVIVPIYKVEKYLDRCIQSIINQTYKNLEIILVDDGSPDNCPKMCDDWAKKDNRIIVIHKQNGGLSDARNFGLDVATGEYVTFVDSDDLLSITFIEKLVEISKEYNAEIVSCGLQRFNDKIILENENIEIIEYNKKQSLENTFKTAKYEFVISCAKLYKSEIFKGLRFTIGKIHEDEFICHRIFDKITKFVTTSEKLYYYYENPNSITGVGYRLKRINYLEALEDRVKFFKENYLEFYADMAMFFAYQCINVYFEIPSDFPQKKLAQKLTKQMYKKAQKAIKGIKTSSKKRFFIFSVSPKLYKRIFL